MTLQNILDNEAISMLPQTKEMLKTRFHRIAGVLMLINSAPLPLVEMSESELNNFDYSLCERIKYLDECEKEI